MLEMIVDKHLLFVLMGAAVAVGLVSKVVTGITLKRLMKAAANMGKSTHPLMRLIRAKYEHACMVSDKVQNVEVFVEKYLHEYRIFGMPLHSWRRMERASAWLCASLGLLAALGEYALNGMGDQVIRSGVIGLAAGILLFLLRISVDETYRLQVIRTYMVDYLENFCARKYEKSREKKADVTAADAADKEKPLQGEVLAEVRQSRREEVPEQKQAPVMEEEEKRPEVPYREEIQAAEVREEKQKPQISQAQEDKRERERKNVPKEVLIREILEEFLA